MVYVGRYGAPTGTKKECFMIASELRRAIADGAVQALSSLVRAGQRRFLRAARLLEWNSPQLEQLRRLDREQPINVAALIQGYTVIAERYIDAFYSPQAALFPGEKGAEAQWWKYWNHVLMPVLVEDDAQVRHILRAAGGLVSKDGHQAGLAFTQHVTAMTLPETVPAWAPEDLAVG